MHSHLAEQVRTVRVMNAVAAGTSTQNGSTVDMSQDGGYQGVRFTALLGALTATQVTKLQVQQSSDGSTWETIHTSSAAADSDGNKLLQTDILYPTKRYVRGNVVRGTANAVIDGVTADLYDNRSLPVGKDSTVIEVNKAVSPSA